MWQTVGERPERLERVDAADAEHDLLADAELLVAAVERAGDRAVGRGVLLEVRVEQEERDAADLHPPELRADDRRAGTCTRMMSRLPLAVEHRRAPAGGASR